MIVNIDMWAYKGTKVMIFNRPFKSFLRALTFLVKILRTPSPTSFRLSILLSDSFYGVALVNRID